jgi:hypothetical protein
MGAPLIARSKTRRFQGNKIPIGIVTITFRLRKIEILLHRGLESEHIYDSYSKIGLRSFFTVNYLSPRCDIDGISPINIHQGTKPKFIPIQQNQVFYCNILI